MMKFKPSKRSSQKIHIYMCMFICTNQSTPSLISLYETATMLLSENQNLFNYIILLIALVVF